MDTSLVIALIGLAGGCLGVAGRIWESFNGSKATLGQNELDKQKLVDENLWKWVEKLQEERKEAVTHLEQAVARMAELQIAHEKLQGFYQGAVQRIDSLEASREKDQLMISDLKNEVERLSGRRP